MSATETLDPHDQAMTSAGSHAGERLRLAATAAQMRGLAMDTALTALNALADLAKGATAPGERHALAAVIAIEASQRARNVDREVARLVAAAAPGSARGR